AGGAAGAPTHAALVLVVAPDELARGGGGRDREQHRREGPGPHQKLLVTQSPAPPGSGAGTIAVAGFGPLSSRPRKTAVATPPAAVTIQPARLTWSIGGTLSMRALPAGVQTLFGHSLRMAPCFWASTTPLAIAATRPAPVSAPLVMARARQGRAGGGATAS